MNRPPSSTTSSRGLTAGSSDLNQQDSPVPDYQIRDLDGRHADAVRALFKQVFAKDLSEDLWSWKYASDDGHEIGVFENGDLVAHYGGIGRDMLYKGSPQKAVQITDVMVKPQVRKSVRQNSPFFLAGKAFLERWIGYGRPYLLGYGFPSDRHMKLASYLDLYAPVGRMVECRWPTEKCRRGWLSKLVRIYRGNAEKHEARIDALWESQADDLIGNIVGVKNADWLRRRYLHHPEHDYDVRLVLRRFGRTPRGLLVLRHMEDHSLLMDVVAPLEQLDELIGCARALAREAGRPQLRTWCARGFTELFQTGGAEQSPLPITVPTNIWTPGPLPEILMDKWWLMPGDTDFL